MSELDRFIEAAGEIRGHAISDDETDLPLSQLGLDSLAITEIVVVAEDLCDSSLFDDPEEMMTTTLIELYHRATQIAVAKNLDDRFG